MLSGTQRIRMRSGTRAHAVARRMSGDMNTSLGNGFTNLMLALFLANEQGCSLHGFVEGDDGLFVTNAKLTTDLYKQLGFTIKMDVLDDPCRASFCGMIFGDSHQIIRDPTKFLMTFGWTHSHISGSTPLMMRLLRSKALSSVYETPNCPIVSALARRALAETEGFEPLYTQDWYHVRPPSQFDILPFNPTPQTRALFSDHYNISVTTQLRIEECIMSDDFDSISLLLPPNPDITFYNRTYLDYEFM